MNGALKQFMPGIGQEITPQDLMTGLQMFKGQGATLGNPDQGGEQQGALAGALQSYRDAMQSMPQSDYAEGSGGLGALAMVAEAAAEKYGQKPGKGGGIFGGKK